MTTKKTKTTKKRVNKRTIEVNPLDLLMICTGEPKDARADTLKRTLDENPKNKAAQEAKAKLLEIEKQKKQSYYQNLCKTYGEMIKKYNFDMNQIHIILFNSVLKGTLSESDVEYLLKNESAIIDSLRAEMAPKELTRDCLVKAIIEIGGECVKNGELSEESFKVLKESLGIKTKKTRKDFNGLPFFKTCIEQFVHRGGDTSRKIILKDQITNPDEIIPDNGTVFTIRVDNGTGSIITYGKDYEEITVAENLGNDDIIRGFE